MSSRPTALPPPGSRDVLYLIDFSGYVFRAYHAVTPLHNPKGEPTHATYGFAQMLNKLVEDRRPVYLGIAMDEPGPRRREAMDENYKATRPVPPTDLIRQLERSKELVRAYNIPVFGAPGVEAD